MVSSTGDSESRFGEGAPHSTYTGTPDIGPGPRLFSTDFTPGRVFAAPSAAVSSAFSTKPQSQTEMAVAHGDVDEDRIEFVLVQQNQFVAKFMRFAIEPPAVSMSVQRSMPDMDRGRDHRMPDAAGR